MDPAAPIVDLDEYYNLAQLPLARRISEDSLSIELHTDIQDTLLLNNIEQEFKSGLNIMRDYLSADKPYSIDWKIVISDDVPKNFKRLAIDKCALCYEDFLILPSDRSKWHTRISSGVASTVHEVSHSLMHPAKYVPWFEEGICEYLQYLYLMKSDSGKGQKMLSDWESSKFANGIPDKVWSYDPRYGQSTYLKMVRELQENGAKEDEIKTQMIKYWEEFDQYYLYYFGIIYTIDKQYGKDVLQKSLRLYNNNVADAITLEKLARKALKE